jgi:hypothetical protein
MAFVLTRPGTAYLGEVKKIIAVRLLTSKK